MRKNIIYLSCFFILFGGASIVFAGVYIEDFEDNNLDPVWYAYKTFEISDGNLHMTAGKDYMGIKESEVGIWFEDEIIYHFSADVKIPEGYNQRVGICLQWGKMVDGVWDGYQVYLKIFNYQIYATLFRMYPGGIEVVGAENIMPGNFDTWYNFSITLHDNYITFGIDGVETDLFYKLFSHDSTLIETNVAYVHAHDGTPDINYYTDNIKAFTATGTSPTAMLDSVQDSFYEWVESGELVGIGKGKSAEFKLNVFEIMLMHARTHFPRYGNNIIACDQLKVASNWSDGQSNPPDFVEGDAVQDLHEMIDILRKDFGCE